MDTMEDLFFVPMFEEIHAEAGVVTWPNFLFGESLEYQASDGSWFPGQWVGIDPVNERMGVLRNSSDRGANVVTVSLNSIRTAIPPADPEFERLLAEEEAIEQGEAIRDRDQELRDSVRTDDPNRMVHAYNEVAEVVRYNRTSKWYIEFRDSNSPRRKVTIGEAAEYALNHCELAPIGRSAVLFLQPGGSTFDRKVHEARRGR